MIEYHLIEARDRMSNWDKCRDTGNITAILKEKRLYDWILSRSNHNRSIKTYLTKRKEWELNEKGLKTIYPVQE